jgi:hypothetical protein
MHEVAASRVRGNAAGGLDVPLFCRRIAQSSPSPVDEAH